MPVRSTRRQLAATLLFLAAPAALLAQQSDSARPRVDTARPVGTQASASDARTSTKPATAKPAKGTATAKPATPRRPGGEGASKYDHLWPVKGPAPLPGSILPGKRIVAYYGNPLSKRMGVLGEYETSDMLRRLDREVANWNRADPSTPVVPALHLVATVAQGAPGKDGKYRLKMDSALIEKVYGWAKSRNAIFFIDIQVGMSDVQTEIPRFAQFLRRPDVHLALDPEFAMARKGVAPGRKIGTMDAAEINWASKYLQDLVTAHKLPPKVLVVHRFTRGMMTNHQNIKLDPRVQIVIDMDGWGAPWLKRDSYRDYVQAEPVQFTGFKLFYHNDTKKGDPIMSPAQVLALNPRPLYIQYQ